MGVIGEWKGNIYNYICILKRNKDVFNILKNYADTN